ncbi:MAG TPA: site-2 protease family protein [Polyangiaceae bacterium]
MHGLDVANMAIWYLVFVFSTTCHEAAHAWVAYRGGDVTAYSLGHVTLDPWPHIRRSPFGMVIVPLVSFIFGGGMIGWASVPVNRRWAVNHPRRAALMSLAGPLANFGLALIALGAMRLLVANDVLFAPTGAVPLQNIVTVPDGHGFNTPLGALARGLSVLLVLNVMLCLFNLVPLPPLDGASALEGALPRATAGFYQRLREVPAFEFLGLMIAWRFFPYIYLPAVSFIADFLHA